MRKIVTAFSAAAFGLLSIGSPEASSYHVQQLLPLPGDSKAHAISLNAGGQAVGWSRNNDGTTSAVLWDGGVVLNLSPGSRPDISYIAADINDLGQIVGFGVACSSDRCDEPFGFHVGPWMGDGPWAALAPGSSAPLPTVEKCGTDSKALLVSNAGYTYVQTAVNSPHSDSLCLGSLPGGRSVVELYENGVIALTDGFLYDPFVDYITLSTGTEFDVGRRMWLLFEGCANGKHADLSDVHSFQVSDTLRAEMCGFINSGYSRDRQQNASGQFIQNIDGRAFLFTPVDAPGTLMLLLLGIAIAGGYRAGLVHFWLQARW
jgi:hypothetical protein